MQAIVSFSQPLALEGCKVNKTIVTTGKVMTMEELSNVQGRAWEDIDVSLKAPFVPYLPSAVQLFLKVGCRCRMLTLVTALIAQMRPSRSHGLHAPIITIFACLYDEEVLLLGATALI